MLHKQKVIIDEFLLREPEKVKKLKVQRNDLMQQNEKLTSELAHSRDDMESMKGTIEKLSCDLERARVDRDGEIAKSSIKDEAVLKLHTMIADKEEKEAHFNKQLALKELKFVQEAARQKAALSEQEKATSTLQNEITQLENDLVMKEQMNEIKDNIREQLGSTIQSLISDGLRLKRVAAERATTISMLKEEITKKDGETRNLNKCLEDGRNETAKALCQLVIDNATKQLQDESRFFQVETEINTLNDKLEKSQERIVAAKQAQERAQALMCEQEEKAADRLRQAEAELNEAQRKKRTVKEMLHAAVEAKNEVMQVNRRMKELAWMQDDRIVEMESKIEDITSMCASEKGRNEKLIGEIAGLAKQIVDMEEQMRCSKEKLAIRNKASCISRRLFAAFRRSRRYSDNE